MCLRMGKRSTRAPPELDPPESDSFTPCSTSLMKSSSSVEIARPYPISKITATTYLPTPNQDPGLVFARSIPGPTMNERGGRLPLEVEPKLGGALNKVTQQSERLAPLDGLRAVERGAGHDRVLHPFSVKLPLIVVWHPRRPRRPLDAASVVVRG